MLYQHVFDKTSSKFHGILCVFVNLAGFRGYPEICSSVTSGNNLLEALNVPCDDPRNISPGLILLAPVSFSFLMWLMPIKINREN